MIVSPRPPPSNFWPRSKFRSATGIRGDSPYTLDDISELHITGNQTAHSFFVHLIKRLIDTDTAPRGFNKVAFVIRSLVDLASANNIIDFLGASKLLENFGMRLQLPEILV